MRFFLTGCLLFILLIGCYNKPPRPATYIFPGMVKITDKLWVDATEVTNYEWKQFLYWKEHHVFVSGEAMSKKILPDTSYWKKVNNLDPVAPAGYFTEPKYNNFPLVGVTYEQAIEYCKWKTDYFNQKYSSFPKYKRTIYRLPSIVEWEKIAADQLDLDQYPFGMVQYYNKECGYAMNVKENHPIKDCGSNPRTKLRFYNDMMVRADGYWSLKNHYTYNMIGNISEMVSEKGIAKGGNFFLPADSCQVRMKQHYTKPEIWLGFRCVVEILD